MLVYLLLVTHVNMNFAQNSNDKFTKILADTTINFDMVGYATLGDSTTGGVGGTIDTIDNFADFQTWVASREGNTDLEIIYIKGSINTSISTVLTIKHGENISIIGIDSTSVLDSIGLVIWDYKNVIVRNIKIHEVFYPGDALSIDECQYVWIDHCELHSKIGEGIGVDTYDGLLDIKKGSKNVTVSWCYLHDHMKTCLIGHTDNEGQAAEDSLMRITMHHNYFANTDGRNPSLRFGAVHYYNNYLENITDYGFAARKRSHALIENNHFHSVKKPIATDKFDDELMDQGFVCLHGNIYSGSCSESDNSITKTDCAFWDSLPYSYAMQDAELVAETVKKYAGIGKLHLDPSILIHDTTTLVPSNFAKMSDDIVRIFPIPVMDYATIQFTVNKPGKIKIWVTDYTGRMAIHIIDSYYSQGNHSIGFSKNELHSGIYLVHMKMDGVIYTKKMIIR